MRYADWVSLRERAFEIAGPGTRQLFLQLYGPQFPAVSHLRTKQCIQLQRDLILTIPGMEVAMMAAMLEGGRGKA